MIQISRRYLYHMHYEIFLLCLFLLIPWPHTEFKSLLCSNKDSRMVHKLVKLKWQPFLDKHKVKLPMECPLHPIRDLFSIHQGHKLDEPSQWVCRLCGRSLYEEKSFYFHFESKHKTAINEHEDAVCLADYCDIFRCELFQTEDNSSSKPFNGPITAVEVWDDTSNQNIPLMKNNIGFFKLQSLRLSALQKKQDTTSPPSNKNALLALNVDDSKRSDKKIKTYFESKHLNFIKSVFKDSNIFKKYIKLIKEENIYNRTNSTKANVNVIVGNVQKLRSACKPEELHKLKIRCQQILRNCVGSLLLSMNTYAFREMEDGMNNAVCAFLSCDRYWEDGLLDHRGFPWVLVIILVLILSTGISFCYYIIWILFDTDETTTTTPVHSTYLYGQCEQFNVSMQRTQKLCHQQPSEYYYDKLQCDYRQSPKRYANHQNQQITPTKCTIPKKNSESSINYSISQKESTERKDEKVRSRSVVCTNVIRARSRANMAGTATDTVASNVNLVGKQYHSLPRSLEQQQRHKAGSQQSLRDSLPAHEIIQNEVSENEHYIYVTYPSDLKKKYF